MRRGGDTPETKTLLKIPSSDDRVSAGYLEDKVFHLYGQGTNLGYQINDQSGEVVSTFSQAKNTLETFIIPRMIEKGYDVESGVLDTSSFEIGDIIPNWGAYRNW